MKLLIDLQGAQTESAFRGIGRYTIELARAMVKNRGDHEVILCLNGRFSESIDRIKADFFDVLPPECIRVWDSPGPVAAVDLSNASRQEVAERVREAFIADLVPDAVLITSLFEGLGDDAVTSIGTFDSAIPTATVLYDLIPLLNPDEHYRNSQIHIDWYARKIESLKRSVLLLAISSSAGNEALQGLGMNGPPAVTIGGGCDPRFRELEMGQTARAACMSAHGISRPFVMYTGGADERKNLKRLIRAFARLPASVRERHQLALVGKMPAGLVNEYIALAQAEGLTDELVTTGYVTDADLVRLYNCCKAFIFPSTHEGLGLPPLEAMACGAPVIAADSTSLPEVVGLAEALFDPLSVRAITGKLQEVLVDEAFRQRLISHGREQRKKFAWDDVGRKAWTAIEPIARKAVPEPPSATRVRRRRTSRFLPQSRRILVVKLDHRGDLLLAVPAISRLRAKYPGCSLVGLIGGWNVDMAKQLSLFDEVHTLDFFKSASADAPGLSRDQIRKAVGKLGRFDLALDLRRPADTRFILGFADAAVRAGYESFDADVDAMLSVKLPGHADVPFVSTPLNKTHITEQLLRLVDALPASSTDYMALPRIDRAAAEPKGRGFVGLFPSAGNDVKQWAPERFAELARRLLKRGDVKGVNVYFGSPSEARLFALEGSAALQRHVGLRFSELVESVATNEVCVANNSFGAHLAGYLGCGVVGIYGGHETVAEWSPPFGNSVVISVDKTCSPCHIGARSECPFGMACLDEIEVDDALSAVVEILENPDAPTAPPLDDTGTEASDAPVAQRLIEELSRLTANGWSIQDKAALSLSISGNMRPKSRTRQLLVDVTELAKQDSRSGIQRVTRAVLLALMRNPPEGFTVEPVVASDETDNAFRYARVFKQRISESSTIEGSDELAEAWHSDVFLGLDLNLSAKPDHWDQLSRWRKLGVSVHFVVYDLLPLQRPHNFDQIVVDAFFDWLHRAAAFDGLLAISKSVERELTEWLDMFGPQRRCPLRLGWFHLGADIAQSAPSKGMPAGAAAVLDSIKARPTLLMVGTVEPRKGYALALAAADLLWKAGIDFNLVIVGKEGWRVPDLVSGIRRHRKIGTRLHWLESASDELLEEVYRRSTALLAASEAEGFGLPLVEAAHRGIPIIARGIPVFREVAGDGAYYFPVDATAEQLADCIRRWLDLFSEGRHPDSAGVTQLTWAQSAVQLATRATGNTWAASWPGAAGIRISALDKRLHSTEAARRQGTQIVATGRGGNLMFGPYVALAPGEYMVSVWGNTGTNAGAAWFDVVCAQGSVQLAESSVDHAAGAGWRAQLPLLLDRPVQDLEVRVFADAGVDLAIDGIALVE